MSLWSRRCSETPDLSQAALSLNITTITVIPSCHIENIFDNMAPVLLHLMVPGLHVTMTSSMNPVS